MTPQGPTWEYLHIVAAPFAIVLAVTGALVGVAGWVAGRERLERWGLVALLLAAVASVPAYVTGLTAADVAAARTFVEPSLVQTHRTWATWTAVASVSVGVFAAFSLLQPEDARLRRFVLVSGMAAAALAGWTAFLGGKIVHGPEADRERIEEQIGRGAGGAGGGGDGTIRPTTPTPPLTRGSTPMARSSAASRRGPFLPSAPPVDRLPHRASGLDGEAGEGGGG